MVTRWVAGERRELRRDRQQARGQPRRRQRVDDLRRRRAGRGLGGELVLEARGVELLRQGHAPRARGGVEGDARDGRCRGRGEGPAQERQGAVVDIDLRKKVFFYVFFSSSNFCFSLSFLFYAASFGPKPFPHTMTSL